MDFPFKLAASAEPSRWVSDSVTTFGENTLSLVPDGFEAYVRILHPAHQLTAEDEVVEYLRWSDVAKRTGHPVNKAMHWHKIREGIPEIHDYTRLKPGETFLSSPDEGSLPADIAQRLSNILAEHTSTPEQCYFGVWYGFFGTIPSPVKQAPTFDTPDRTYYLCKGAIGLADTSLYADYFGDAPRQSVNLWWPADRTWFVITEIDLKSTYVGGSREAVNAILECEELEAYEVLKSDAIF